MKPDMAAARARKRRLASRPAIAADSPASRWTSFGISPIDVTVPMYGSTRPDAALLHTATCDPSQIDGSGASGNT